MQHDELRERLSDMALRMDDDYTTWLNLCDNKAGRNAIIALLREAAAALERQGKDRAALQQIVADVDEGAYSAEHAMGHLRQLLAATPEPQP